MLFRIAVVVLLAATTVALYGQDSDQEQKDMLRLIEAAHTGDVESVFFLINNGVPVNQHEEIGNVDDFIGEKMSGYSVLRFATPLKAALSSGNDLLAVYLLGRGAKCTNSVDYKAGYSELFYLVRRKKETQNMLTLAKMLICAGADPTEKITGVSKLEEMNLDGKTLQQIALQKGHRELAELLEKAANEAVQEKGVCGQK